ncbi:MFS transporter [Gulosibacter chungangensis]|uniref:MHS family MFS transporter n=1 Tax=Gulosibacter chungangensis TaxID=979746 RepID=A0A7J5BAF2_9MICO|nr:MFS transporter [Gulosibacter chungangensis]KAB1641205.1 MHS family MFS transporter [Gulosibacter chungangensis]
MTNTATAEDRRVAAERRRIVGAVVVGTTVEWYDFFVYATMAGLVLAPLFFEPATQGNEGFATILSFLTVGISFLFRPLGAFLAGHFGDKIGRKPMLVITLLLMGAATFLIGMLPTYSGTEGDWFGGLGIAAPVLLLFLRVLQGISAGGEWGGAVLMATEHSATKTRGRMGMFPQLGVPFGMLLASGMIAAVTALTGDNFTVWGWRIPFLFSIILVVIGFIVRHAVEESPVYKEIEERQQQASAPIATLFRKHGLSVILLAALFIGNNAAGYMTTGGYMQNYATKTLGMDVTFVMLSVLAAAAVWAIFTFISGFITDKIGRKKSFFLGYSLQMITVWVLFAMANTGEPAMLFLGLVIFAIPLGLTYGPIAVWYVETFPASVRFSGVSIGYALGAILGGAFAPTIATWLMQTFNNVYAISTYLFIATVISLIAAALLKDRTGIPLTHSFEESGKFDTWKPGDPTKEEYEALGDTVTDANWVPAER